MRSVFTQAWKSWKAAKGIALLAVLALAVGIGSTTAIYTVVNTVMLGLLPYANGDRFVALYSARIDDPEHFGSHAPADLVEYQRRTSSFDVFGWFRLDTLNLTSPGEPRHVNVTSVTRSLSDNLGVPPTLGRWFGADSEAVISHELWRRLGESPAILGKSITLERRILTVVGVMPRRFHLPVTGAGTEGFNSDLWIDLNPASQADAGLYFAYGRRGPGVTLAQARDDVKRAAVEIAALNPATHPSYTARLDSLYETTVSNVRPTLLLLFGAAGLLLLIACANVAGLLLARSVARARETATRIALGASRRQLAWHYFTEGLSLSLVGAAGGVLLSMGIVRLVLSMAGGHIPRAEEIAVDWKVLLFSAASAVVASGLSSLAPLWQAYRTPSHEVLSSGVRASAGQRVRRLSSTLVVAEIALAFALLGASTILIAHLRNLTSTSPGFDPRQLLTFSLSLPQAVASDEATRTGYQRRLLEALEGVPGVTGVAFGSGLPLDGCCFGGNIYAEARLQDKPAERTSFVFVSSEYLQTLHVPLRGGRLFTENDRVVKDVAPVIVNQTAAHYYWPGESPVGKFGRMNRADGSRFEVIGMVGDVKNDGLGATTVPEFYFPSAIFDLNLPMTFIVRSPLPSERLVPDVRRAVQTVDAVPIYDVAPMSDIVGESVVLERVRSLMTTWFALAALLMATLGVFGVVSYGVRLRRVEIGTRMALGAVPRDVLRLVIGGGLRLAAYGLAIGGVAVVVTAWLLARFAGVNDISWPPFVISTTSVLAVTTVASSFPAWRATLLSPMVAIRDETPTLWQAARRTIERVMKDVTGGGVELAADGTLLSDFVSAVRHAVSPAEAVQVALETLCERLEAESAMLLEKVPDQEYGEYSCTAASPPTDAPRLSLPASGFLLSRLRYHSRPLPLSEGDIDTLLRWASDHHPDRLAEVEVLRQARARLAVSLRTKEEILGVLLLGPPVGRAAYSSGERQVLRGCADQFALMIENARLTGRIVEQEKLRRDLALAAEVQRGLLPDSPPEATSVSLAAVSLPARTVGGDYYDFVDVGENRIGIALADVSGKGVAAALIMSVVQASLRIISSEGKVSLPQLAENMNRFLHRSTASNRYATFFYAELDETKRQLRYVNAGHNPPYLVRAITPGSARVDEPLPDIEELATGGSVIGLFPHMTYEEATIDLQSGDVLVAFTDGVTEALNETKEEFGEERLKDLLRGIVHLPVQDISSRISQALRDWIRDAAQYDDLTFVVMKVK